MMMVKNVFGEYIPMNEEDVEELLLANKKLLEANEELKHMRKIVMKLITARTTLEHYAGLNRAWWITDAIKDIDFAIEETIRRYGDEGEQDNVL